jgi:hypothetical protein
MRRVVAADARNDKEFTVKSLRFAVRPVLALSLAVVGCGGDTRDDHDDHCDDGHVDEHCPGTGGDAGVGDLPNTLFVAHEGSLVSYDIASGDERPGTVTNVTGPVDMQALEDGTVMVNLTGRNEVLAIDGHTMLEVARIPSSGIDGVRPVHSYITPERDGARYFVALNDGSEGQGNSASFIDIATGSPTRFERVGEVALGVGHHKAAFSATQARVVASNIGDCADVLTVYDYSDIGDIRPLATLTGAAAGFDAADPGDGNFDPSFCDPTYQRGLPPAPHGCATSKVSGKAYCNLTSSGALVVVDIDAETPTFEVVATTGKGGGKTHAHPDGRYVYSLQEEPRGGCQIGQMVVLDAMTDAVVRELPLGYTGPDCDEDLAGTPAETANPDHFTFSADHGTLFVGVAGGFGADDARVDQHVVLDMTNPAQPVQLPSIQMGVSTGHSSDALSGDGAHLFCVDAVDETITEVDPATRAVVRTLEVGASPKVVTTYGSAEGPSPQEGPIH